MPRLMLIRTKYEPVRTAPYLQGQLDWTAWVAGREDFGVGSGPTQTAAVEALMEHINSLRLRDSLRKSLEQVTA